MRQRVPCGPYGSAGYPHLSQPTTSPEGLQRITADVRERPRCQDAGLMGPARRRCYCSLTTGSKRHARGNPRPSTRVAVATCRRMVFTQGVSRTWHQRGRTGFGISGSGSRGRHRTARRERLFVFRMGPSSNKRLLPPQAAINTFAICTGRHSYELLKAAGEMALIRKPYIQRDLSQR
jgi:hypothetical protein